MSGTELYWYQYLVSGALLWILAMCSVDELPYFNFWLDM